jgi:hypothetical protein
MYVAVATKRIEQLGERKTSFAYGLAIARLERLFNLSMTCSEIRDAVLVLKELHKIQGLHKIERPEQSPEEFARRLREQMQMMEAVTLGICTDCLGRGCRSCNLLNGQGALPALPSSSDSHISHI